jgi:hypothetical protein
MPAFTRLHQSRFTHLCVREPDNLTCVETAKTAISAMPWDESNSSASGVRTWLLLLLSEEGSMIPEFRSSKLP